MRPTVEEQLRGMRRILDEVVAPQVSDAYAREQLGHVTTALDGLAARWDTVVPALRNENAALAELLRRLLPDVAPLEVASAVRARMADLAAADLPDDELHFAPHHEHNQALRGCVAQLIAALDAAGDDARVEPVRAAIHDTLRRGLED